MDIPWAQCWLRPALLFDGRVCFRCNVFMDRNELRLSRRKHLDIKTRGHFWTEEERRHAPEVQEGEGREYTTALDTLVEYLGHLDLSADRVSKLEPLRQAIEDSALRYVTTRVEFSRAAQQREQPSLSAYQSLMESADRSRNFAHNRLVDSIQIAVRNYFKAAQDEGIPWEIPEISKDLLTGSEPATREAIANGAIDFVWQILDDEEAEERSVKIPA